MERRRQSIFVLIVTVITTSHREEYLYETNNIKLHEKKGNYIIRKKKEKLSKN